MNKLISWWIDNKVAANLLMAGMIVAGYLSMQLMGKEIVPKVRVNMVQVVVPWPGAGPRDVEEQVVLRVESAFSGMENVEWIRSKAQEGVGIVILRASPKADFTEFVNDVKNRLDSISSLPRDIERPQIVTVYDNGNENMRLAVHGKVSEKVLKQTADKLLQSLILVPGAERTEIFGVRREEVSIEVSEQALRRYGLTIEAVANAIRSSSINLSSGGVRTKTGDVLFRAASLAGSEEDFAKIVIRETPDGGIVRAGDVATVIDGFEDEDFYASYNGEPAALLQIRNGDRDDVVALSEGVRKWLDEIRPTLPEGVSVDVWEDMSEIYKDRMALIASNTWQGLALILLVLMLTLRPKVAIWVTSGIGIAFAGTFILLPGNGITLNLLSTFAFIMVSGIIVDDSIVVGESIYEEGLKTGGGREAAIRGARLIAKPLIFCVATTILAFIPWLFLTGESVQLTRQITIVVISALCFSLCEALFILPAHLVHLPRPKTLTRLGAFQERIAGSMVTFAHGRYRRILETATANRYTSVIILFTVLISAFVLLGSGYIRTRFNPEIESDQVTMEVTMPDGTTGERATEILHQLQKAERALEEEENKSGQKLVKSWYTRMRRDNILAIVQLTPPETREATTEEIATRLRGLVGDIPDAQRLQVSSELNQSSPPIQYRISHPDLDMLGRAVADLRAHLQTYGTAYDVSDTLSSSSDEMRIALKPGAEQLGVTLFDVSRQLRQAYYGEEVQRLPRTGGDVKVMVRYPVKSRREMASLDDFRIRTAQGGEVPLSAVADVTFGPGLKQIERYDRSRSAEVSAWVSDDRPKTIMDDVEKNFIPAWEKRHPGIKLGNAARSEGEAKFMAQVGTLYMIAGFVMYAMLAVAFRSYTQPFLIMLTIPFSLAGALYGHLITNSALGIFSYFGIAAAAGVVVNHNIVLMDKKNRLVAEGVEHRKAVHLAAVSRFRAIVLTAVTEFVGLLPLLTDRSIQAGFLKPAAISICFGIIMAVFVTLIGIPCIYLIALDAREAILRLKARLAAFWQGGREVPSASTIITEPAE